MTVTLGNLAHVRMSIDLNWSRLAHITGIDWVRLKQLESAARYKTTEPWFDEALILARACCTAGIYPLVCEPDSLIDLDLGTPLPGQLDFDLFRSGMRISLSVACRVARQLGLSDPVQLVQPPHELMAEMWRIIETGERTRAPGQCPWCAADIVGGAAHLPTCLPQALFAPRGKFAAPHIKRSVPPEQRGWGTRASAHAWGLRAQRDRLGLKQAEMAVKLGFKSTNHYALMERCQINMTMERAQTIGVILGIDYAELYAKPEEMAADDAFAEHGNVSDDLTESGAA